MQRSSHGSGRGSGVRCIVMLVGLVMAVLAGLPGHAQTQPTQSLSALARLDPTQSQIAGAGGGLAVTLALSQPVPWRVRLLDAPPRLVLDLREVDWTGLDDMPQSGAALLALRAGVFRPGWSRLVIELAGPMQVTTAEMTTDQGAVVRLRLDPASAADFAAQAALPEPADWALPVAAMLPPPIRRDNGPLIVVLDPGHGGLDPGAERDGQTEASLLLAFARALKELLVRDGGFAVIMTREDDLFVPLETRISIARAAGADVFLSLHADAIAEGEAVGATIYTLDAEASDEASAALAERHNRDDLLAGVDLTEQDDLVAEVLMDMARTTTAPRTARLSDALQMAMQGAGIRMHRRPQQRAGFSVLKSPDIPSVLVELGFLSSAGDLARLNDPDWRARMTAAMRDGLLVWAATDSVMSKQTNP